MNETHLGLYKIIGVDVGLPEAVGDVSLLWLVPAEGGVELQEALRLQLLQLLLVNVVIRLVPAAEVENCRPHGFSLRLLPRPLLPSDISIVSEIDFFSKPE